MMASADPATQAAPGYLVPANLLSDSEIIILALKPSGWFVLASSLPVVATAAAVAATAFAVGLLRPYE